MIETRNYEYKCNINDHAYGIQATINIIKILISFGENEKKKELYKIYILAPMWIFKKSMVTGVKIYKFKKIFFSEINTYIYRCRRIISIQNCFVK